MTRIFTLLSVGFVACVGMAAGPGDARNMLLGAFGGDGTECDSGGEELLPCAYISGYNDLCDDGFNWVYESPWNHLVAIEMASEQCFGEHCYANPPLYELSWSCTPSY